ncbi:Hypp100 [Branchiostoma lanceolatum]|uniref:Hypp100 protein n=1 Tax=Branchiostoma lanceolatum TaxID=7740 RepID=A0A8J9YN32_BRALA|nr:Hypp100 [Branchiostoma lanceolatum]
MAVCIPLHNLSELTGHWTEEDLNPNAFPLRRLRSRESRWSAMKTGDTIYSGHCGAEAHPADAVGTTEAQVHHYDNDDASNADEEVQYHLYASAEPPLPVYEEAAAHAVDADVLEYHLYASAEPPPLPVFEGTAAHAVDADVLEGLSEQPAFQIGNAETGEDEMPYGVAEANSLYQRGSDLNRGTLTDVYRRTLLAIEHPSSTAANYCATDTNQIEERPYATTDGNALYQRDTVQNRRNLTSEHTSIAAANYCATDTNQMEERPYATAEANRLYQWDANRRTLTSDDEHTSTCSAAANYCAADPNQTETIITDLYGQQTGHTDMARDINTTSRDSEEDFGILYGSDATTAE